MDYDDNDSQSHNLNLAGEGNSKSSPILRPYALPKFDFDDSLQGHLRFDSLVENEVFLGISSQEDSQWIEDFSRGNSGIEFSSSATESCSISRCNNVWSEATSPESVAMLLKSVGQEERIRGETVIKESDAGNALGKVTTEMEPKLKQDNKLEDVTNSQPTAAPDNFPDGRNVNALESQKDTPTVDGSSGVVLNVSTGGFVSEDVTNSQPTAVPDNFPDRWNVNALKSQNVSEDVTNSQPTAVPDNFLDGRNVNALESQKDTPTVDGSSGDVLNVSTGVFVSEADVSEDVTNSQPTAVPDNFPDGRIVNALESQKDTPTVDGSSGDVFNVSTGVFVSEADVSEDVTNSQPTAVPDNFPDGRNVNALESQKDTPTVDGSSGDVLNVSTGVFVSEANVGSDRKFDETNKVEVKNLEKSLVDNLKGVSSEIHVQNVISLSQSDIASSSQLNGQENEHQVTDACFETDGLVTRIMVEQNIRSTESNMVDLVSSGTGGDTCTHYVENPQSVVSDSEALVISFDEPKVTSGFQIEEAYKSDKGSIEPSQQGNIEVAGCNEDEKNCKPLQYSLRESSVACLDDTGVEEHTFMVVNINTGNSACTELGTSSVEEKEKSCGNQMESLESQNVEVVDTKTGNSLCPALDMDSTVENKKFENHVGGGSFAESSLLRDVDQRVAEREGSGIKHVGNPYLSQSCTVSRLHCEKQLSTEDLSDVKTPTVLKEDAVPEARISSLVLGGHEQISKNNSSEHDGVHSFDEDVPLHGRGDAKTSPASLRPDEISKADLAHGSEFVESTSNESGSKDVADEMFLSSSDTVNGLPLLSGANASADGVTLCDQGQNSQITNLLGFHDFSQVATDSEPESGQEKAAAVGCSTKVEACSVLIDSTVKQVDGSAAACKSHEETLTESNAEVALHEVAASDVMLLSSQSVVPTESVSVSMVEPFSTTIQKDHEVIVTSGSQATGNPSTKVELAEDNQDSVALACPSKDIECVNKDGDASANSVKENPYPPSVISFAKTPLSENGQQVRIKEASVGSVLHSGATPGAGGKVQYVPLHFRHDGSHKETDITFEVSSSTGLSEGETIKGSQSYPIVQVYNKSMDVKGYPFEGNPHPASIISCAKTPLSEIGQPLGTKEASAGPVQHSELTPDAGRKVQSVAMHMQHDNLNKGKNITFEVSSSTGLSEGETIKGSHSHPRVQVHIKSTDVKGYPLASDCSQIDLTMVPENSQGPGPMSGKKSAGAKGTSERKTRRGSVKTSTRENAKERGRVQETPVKQFEGGDKSMMFLSSTGTAHLVQFEELKPSSNAEISGAQACGVLPIPISNIPDLNTSVTPAAYLQQPFTDLQQVQLRAQILVHGSLMQNSVPEEACMISAFGQSDESGCLWGPAWHACSERVHSQKSHGSNLETPARSRSGSRGADQPVKNSSLQSKTPSPAGRASSKGSPSPVVNPSISLSSPLWNVSTPCDGLQSSGTFVHYHQPFAPMQPYQAPGIIGFVEQSPSWLSQTHFPGQWVASPQTSALDVNACVSLIPCTEPVKLTPAKVSSVPNHPVIKQATHLSVSTGGAGVSSGSSSQPGVNTVTVLSGQNSVNPKPKKRKKFPVSMSPGKVPLPTLNHAASVSDAINHLSEKVTATQGVAQKSLLAQNLPEMGSSVVNVLSTSNAATPACFASTSSSGNNLAAVSTILLSNQPTRVDQIVEQKSIVSEEILNAVEVAKLQAEDAAAHAATAVGNCNDVWSQLNKLKNSGLRSDDETKLSSAAMAIAAAASVAKAAAAAAKLASNVAVEAKLMADEVSTISVAENNTQNTRISLSRASNSSPMAGEGNISASLIIAAVKETVKKRVEAATAASKHAENLVAIVKATELAAEAVSQAGKIVSMGDPLPLRELVDSGPMNYWKTLRVSPELGAHIDQSKAFSPEKLVPAEQPKVGAAIMGEAVNPGTVTSIRKNSSSTQRGHTASYTARIIDTAPESYCGTNSEAVTSGDAHKTASGTTFENEMVEGCLVEVFKGGGTRKAAWYSAKILNLKDGKAFVCYSELQADEGSGKLKEWVPLEGDGFKAPTLRIAHPTTSMCPDGTRKRRRAEMMDYTWCAGDRVDAWMQDCWLEGYVKERNKNDETALTIYFPALGDTLAMKTWHLRPARTWQEGKWIGWPTASRKSPSQGETPREKRAKLGHLALEAAKEDKISRGVDILESKQHEESSPLPLSANEKEYNIGTNTRDNKLDAQRAVWTGLQKEGSRVVFGVPKPGKKRKFMDVSKHLDSDQSSANTKTGDPIKFARNLMPQGSGGRSWNKNTTVDIKEKQAAENKPKVLRSGKSQSILGRALPQKINSSASAKSTDKVIDENNSGQQELMEFGSVSDSQDTSEGPTLVSLKGLPRVSRKKVPSSNANSVQLNKGKLAATSGELRKKVEQDKSFSRVAEPRRSNRKIQPTSRLLEGLQSSLITSKVPSVPHEKIQRNQNRGNFKAKQ